MDTGRPPYRLDEFPDMDWEQPIEELLGLGWNVVWRLRRDARLLTPGAKPYRAGRRCYSIEDYPGVDWNAPTREILEKTGVSRRIIYRLIREAGVNPSLRKLHHQSRKTQA